MPPTEPGQQMEYKCRRESGELTCYALGGGGGGGGGGVEEQVLVEEGWDEGTGDLGISDLMTLSLSFRCESAR